MAFSEWRSFSNAPEDGTEILVWREDAGVFIASFCPSAGDDGEFGPQMNGEERWFTMCGEDISDVPPTHWQPLPAPPQ